MPVKSKKQYNFMQMMAHNPSKSTKKGIGPSPKVAEEMISKTSSAARHNFAKKK